MSKSTILETEDCIRRKKHCSKQPQICTEVQYLSKSIYLHFPVSVRSPFSLSYIFLVILLCTCGWSRDQHWGCRGGFDLWEGSRVRVRGQRSRGSPFCHLSFSSNGSTICQSGREGRGQQVSLAPTVCATVPWGSVLPEIWLRGPNQVVGLFTLSPDPERVSAAEPDLFPFPGRPQTLHIFIPTLLRRKMESKTTRCQ